MTASTSSAPQPAPTRILPSGVLLLIGLGVALVPIAYFLSGPTVALALLLVVATAAAVITPITVPVTVIVLAPLLGQFAGDHLGPFNAISILSLWFLGMGTAIALLGHRIILRERFLLIPALLVAITAASILVTRYPAVTATEIIRSMSAMMMLPVALIVGMRYRNRIAIVTAILASSVIPLAVGYYQKITGDMSFGGATLTQFEIRTGLVRIYATFFDVHPFAKYLMILLLLLLALVVTAQVKSQARWAYAALFAITFLAFIFTYARGQLISFLAGAFMLLLAAGKMRLRFLIVVIPLVVITFYYAGVLDRFEDIVQPNSAELAIGSSRPSNSLERRFHIWRQVLPKVRGGLVLGHGADTFQYAAGVIAHNDYLGLLYEIGVGGLLLYVAFLASAGWRCWRSRKLTGLSSLDRSLILAALGISVAVAVGSIAENLYRSTIMWWFYMAILGCALAITSSKVKGTKVKADLPPSSDTSNDLIC